MMPSRKPGQFSTSVVSINCPPASSPSMMSGFRLARAEYSAAVSPAGPEPMTITFREAMARSDVLVDHLLEGILIGQADNLLDDLSTLEQQERGNAADAEP